MSHTPGPWIPTEDRHNWTLLCRDRVLSHEPPNVLLARFFGKPSKADAILAAAAPDMLEALRRAFDALLECSHLAQASGGDWTEGSEKAFYAVEAAIAKATNTKGGNIT